WPQFPADASPELKATLQAEAAAQYQREQLTWIDLARFPDEPENQQSSRFTEPAVRAAADAFRKEYASLAALRKHHASPLPETVRPRLESLGYIDSGNGPAFRDPAVALPPPRAG